jgi:hypothetical protein
MRRWDESRAIFQPYSRLRKASEEARYEGTLFRPSDVVEFERLHRLVRDAMLRAIMPGTTSS